MSILYIAGDQRGVGKTALATALAQRLRQAGRSVAIVKPLRLAEGSEQTAPVDPDPPFYRQVLSDNPVARGWPVSLTTADLQSAAVVEQAATLVREVKAEVTIVEGLDGLTPESPAAQTSATLVQALDARVVALAQHTSSLDPMELIGIRQTFGSSLLGLIINNVSHHGTHDASTRLLPTLQAQDLHVLGAIPEDRRMLAPSLRDMADHLEGEFRLLEERADDLVEHWMIGGWFLDPGDYVFSRRQQKAVIVKGDRPDLQMAALRTSTVGLVLTEGHNPIQYITYHAQQEEVPLILVQSPTLETMERLQTVADRVTIHNLQKVAQFSQLLAQHCDLTALDEALSLS